MDFREVAKGGPNFSSAACRDTRSSVNKILLRHYPRFSLQPSTEREAKLQSCRKKSNDRCFWTPLNRGAQSGIHHALPLRSRHAHPHHCTPFPRVPSQAARHGKGGDSEGLTDPSPVS